MNVMMKIKIGAKRLYNKAHPRYEFAEHLSFRRDQKRRNKTAQNRKRKFFCKRVRRMLKNQLNDEIEYEQGIEN